MKPPRLPRMGRERAPVTWAVMFTDLVGSTALRVRVGERAFDNIRIEMDRTVESAVRAHGGEVVKTAGDGAMARFTGTASALRCAVAIQRAMADRNRSNVEPIVLRVGLSVGDAAYEAGDPPGT